MSALPTLFGISVIVFTLGQILPGDPALIALGVSADGRTLVDPAAVARVRHELGLDRPAIEQFSRWLGGVLVGDLGRSFVQPTSVASLIVPALPVTLTLVAATMATAAAIGIPLGIVSAFARGRAADYVSRILSVLGISAPVFWVALLLVLAFAYTIPIFPISGSASEHGPIALVLPVLAIATQPAALIARIMRSSMLEVLSQDYIRTAIAKGLSPFSVIVGHALKNAISPVITVIGFQFGNLIGAAVAVERIFALPGLGSLLLDAIFAKDLLVIQGVVLVIAVVFVLANLAVDLAYGAVDPRLRARPS